MRISEKKLALTSVAYAVALVAVSAVASANQNFAPTKAVAAEVQVQDPNTVQAVFDRLHGATTLSAQDLSQLLYAVGFRGKNHRTAWAIAMRESHRHPLSVNKNAGTGDNSYGLFQINMLGSMGADRREKYGLVSNQQLLDPVTNAVVAFAMTGGDDFSSWGLGANPYRSGAGESTISMWYDEYPGIVRTTD
jgi:Lysozyme like domain